MPQAFAKAYVVPKRALLLQDSVPGTPKKSGCGRRAWKMERSTDERSNAVYLLFRSAVGTTFNGGTVNVFGDIFLTSTVDNV